MTPHPPAPPITRRGAPSRAPGLLLAVPAVLTALLTLAVPSVQTIVRSFQVGGGLLGFHARSAGLKNYTHLFGEGDFWKALAFSLSLAVVPLLVILVVGPALAAALDGAGTWPRRTGRVLLSLPLVTFSPVAIAAAWLVAQRDGGIATMFGQVRATGHLSLTLPLITAASMFGLLCGLALLVFLPVMRGRSQGRPLTPAMIAVGSITVLAGVAVSVQALSTSLVMVAGRQPTLAMLEYRSAFAAFDFGSGAAVATVMGLLLGALGIVATVVAVRTGLRIDLGPKETGPRRPADGGRFVLGVIALAVVVIVAVICSWPWLSGVFSDGHTPPLGTSTARVYANTWIPPVLSAIVSVGTAFLAALGIGGLRPLGRRSEWLLLVFSPWLFVGSLPLGVVNFDNAHRLGVLNHFVGLLPPLLLSVPSLLVLTLFCRSRSARWRAERTGGAPAFFRQVVVPALPLAALMGGVTVLFGAHGLLWSMLVATDSSTQTAPVVVLRELSSFASTPSLGIATPLVIVVLLFLALAALQVFYLDRLVITTGPVGEPEDDVPSAALAQQPAWPGPGYGTPPPGPYGPGPYGQGPYGPGPSSPGPYGPPPGPGGPYGPPPRPGGYGPPPAPPGSYGPPAGPGGYRPPPGYGPPPPPPPPPPSPETDQDRRGGQDGTDELERTRQEPPEPESPERGQPE